MKNKCRVCSADIKEFMSLGQMPIANAFVKEDKKNKQFFYNLKIGFCEKCFTLQLIDVPKPEQMFNDSYAYLASTSSTMINHFSKLASKIINYSNISNKSFVVEVGSNDGIFLKNFSDKNIKHLGIDASKNVCDLAEKKGVKTLNEFFNLETSEKIKKNYGEADIIVSTNTMHHIENINEVVRGMANLIKDDGIIITEDPSLLEMLKNNAYDQVYAEHMYIWSLSSMKNLLNTYNLEVFDIENNEFHGGCTRYYIAKKNKKKITSKVIQQQKNEDIFGVKKVSTYLKFKENVAKSKEKLVKLLKDLKSSKKIIVGYGAPAKSTTILNYCKIDNSLIEKIFDNSETKINKMTPGTSLIDIVDSKEFKNFKSDYCVLFAWNHKNEILLKEKEYSNKNGKWIIPVSDIEII